MRTTLSGMLIVAILALGCLGAGCAYSTEAQSTPVDTPGATPAYIQVYDHIYTPAGKRVTVAISGLSATFPEVTAAGYTDIAVSYEDLGGSLPSEVSASSPLIDITTTASYNGPIAVSLVFSESVFHVADEKDAKLLYRDGTRWVDATTSVDTVRNIVYGDLPALAPFCIVQSRPDSNPFAAIVYFMALVNLVLGVPTPGASLTPLGGEVAGDVATIVHGITTMLGQLLAWIQY